MLPIVPQVSTTNNPQVQEYVDAARAGMNAHFVAKSHDGWRVRRLHAQKATGVYNTKREAIARAKTIAKNQRSSVYVLGNDGHISEQFAY